MENATANELTLDAIITSFKSRELKSSDFEIIKYLDEGSYGEISLVLYKPLNFICVQKEISKSTITKHNKIDQLYLERDVLMTLRSHLNFVQYFGSRDGKDAVYFYYEYCQLGNLKKLKRTRKLHRQIIMTSLVRSIKRLHEMGYVHRDIKPENIFMRENGSLVLGDFGEVCKIGSINKFSGTVAYSAPEGQDKGVQKEYDYFSLGVLLYNLIFGENPFSGDNDYQVLTKIRNDEKGNIEHVDMDEKEIIETLLSQSPETRSRAFNQPYFSTEKSFSSDFMDFVTFSPEIFPDRKMIFESDKYVEKDEIILFVTSLKRGIFSSSGKMIVSMKRIIFTKANKIITIDKNANIEVTSPTRFTISNNGQVQIVDTAIPISNVLSELQRLIEFYKSK